MNIKIRMQELAKALAEVNITQEERDKLNLQIALLIRAIRLSY